jgi:hypothetical protein
MKNEDHFGQADHLKHELMYLFPFEDASSAAKHNIGEAMIINWSSNKAIDFSAMKSYVIQPQTQQATSYTKSTHQPTETLQSMLLW